MIGATTENPYFEVNGALISRSSVFELKSLEKEDIRTLLKRAVYDENKGMGTFTQRLTRMRWSFWQMYPAEMQEVRSMPLSLVF